MKQPLQYILLLKYDLFWVKQDIKWEKFGHNLILFNVNWLEHENWMFHACKTFSFLTSTWRLKFKHFDKSSGKFSFNHFLQLLPYIIYYINNQNQMTPLTIGKVKKNKEKRKETLFSFWTICTVESFTVKWWMFI